MNLLYSIGIRVYGALIFFASFFNEKAKKWRAGRKGWDESLKTLQEEENLIWIHVSSYGEYEQALPVIEKCKESYPDHYLLLSFYSPSGYEVFKDKSKADKVVYLPLDTKRNAKRFLELVRPKVALFVKYDFWYNILNECSTRGVPVIYFSLVARPNQLFFKPFGRWFKKVLQKCKVIYTRDERSCELMREVGFENVEVGGDTRYETVLANKDDLKLDTDILRFSEGHKLLVFGNVWKQDVELISTWAGTNLAEDEKLLLVPHEFDKIQLQIYANQFSQRTAFYSKGNFEQAQILIVDAFGLLKSLYSLGQVNYVGGGFGAGIHNLLEPGVFGKPLFFGPKYDKFPEAHEMIALKLGASVGDQNEFDDFLNKNKLLSPGDQKDLRMVSERYFSINKKASNKVLASLQDILSKD